MKSIRFHSLKDATRQLFLETPFDLFYLMEASFSCAASFTIDGHCNRDFFSQEDQEEALPAPFVPWSFLRPVCFQIIKGKRTPISFHLVFFLPKSKAASLFSAPELEANADIDGFLLIVHYKNQILTATTGTSFFRFSMDRESEQLWDRRILQWLDQTHLSYEEQ